MKNIDREKLVEIMKRQTEERLKDPVKLREWIRKVHGPEMRELKDEEAEKMLLVLELIGHYADTNNQRTQTYFYKYADKEYRVTYGLGDKPLVEEVLNEG